MATYPKPAHSSFRTCFGLQLQVRLVLMVAMCFVVGASAWAYLYQRRLSDAIHQAIDVTARQSELAGQITLQILQCGNHQDRLGRVWNVSELRQKPVEDWRRAHARLEALFDGLQDKPLSEADRRRVTLWQRAVRRQGEEFVGIAQRLDQGLTSRDQLRAMLARKECHFRALLQEVEGFAARRMAELRAEGTGVQHTLATVRHWVFVRGAVEIMILGVASWWFSQCVIGRIRRLTAVVSRFANGELQSRAPAHLRDELGILCHQFNEMAAHVESSLNRLNEEIAHRKKTAGELIKAEQASQIAARAKTEFLATVSHEIRTPMTAILGFSEVLSANVANPEAADAAETIRRNGVQLLEIIDDILDLSKLDVGRLEMNLAPCSPRKVLADVMALMRVRADGKGISLQVEIDGQVPETIETDPTRLRQILVNLVGNAIKFTETGGVRVVVCLADACGDQVQLRCDVIDSGIGIEADRLRELFTPFTQGDSSMRRRFGGSGLGLTISKRLAEMLGGTITVRSQLGEGSTFTLTITAGRCEDAAPVSLPGSEDRKETLVESPIVPPPARLHGRVLLAEDGPDNQRLISFLLKKAGAEVTIAENGKVAVERALSIFPKWRRRHTDKVDRFDLILMDMQMPVMDGYEATRRLRRAGYRGPIIALTAHALTEDRQKCLDAGCDDYLTKPVDRDRFLVALAAILPADGQAGQLERCMEIGSRVDS